MSGSGGPKRKTILKFPKLEAKLEITRKTPEFRFISNFASLNSVHSLYFQLYFLDEFPVAF
ncbi:hypothetical protein SBC2_75920 (plasmid) [Caballeronia sp. SBC2]|nr:hypothetical protein SBC2_75920 [Caballeronia sp. SBC2]